MKLHFSIWIFILCLTKSNGFMVLKVNGINEEQLLSNFYNLLRTTEANSYEHHRNNIIVRGGDKRRNFDISKLKNKVIIKRNIPHGYRTLGYEYDENANTLYKPLFRVHKNKKDNYDLMFILDENNIENILNELSSVRDNAPEVQEFTGDEIENVISEFIANKKEKEPVDVADIKLLFGPIGMLNAKQLKRIPTKKKTLRNALENLENSKLFERKQDINKDRGDKFIEDIMGIVIHERNKKNKFTHYRNYYEPDESYNKFNRKDTKTRDLIQDNKHRLHWFGPVGYVVGKQTKRDKQKASGPFRSTHKRINTLKMEAKSVLDYPEKRKERLLKPKKLWHKERKEIGRSTKSNEEQDPLSPQKLYLNEDQDSTTPKPKKWLPKYSFWDFWTYDKTLYQDECKGDLVRLGEVCVALPPN